MPRTRTVAYAASIATPQAAILTTSDGTAVPLTSVNATGRLQGLVFELTVEQRYASSPHTP